MITERELFLRHVAQTSHFPLSLEIEKARGCYLYEKSGTSYLDLISGIAVSNLGHGHPAVLKAIKDQLDKYMHLMVYGEYIQSPQVKLAELLASVLPPDLSTVYFVNSGAEAIEGAMKLAKRFTGRKQFISFRNAYHGSTQGALSLMGDERLKKPFYPLLSDVIQLEFNNEKDLEKISPACAAVVVEPIQGEAGVILPDALYLKKLREKCTETGTLLIFDEIQTGYGRTGTMFAFERYKVIPDILCLAKGMGGGMPLGAFISSRQIMSSLSENPELGHITTFGGHPVCCAAGLATLQMLISENLMEGIEEKHRLFSENLSHDLIVEKRGIGLFIALEFANFETTKKLIDLCLKSGLIVDWFLFNTKSLRIAPPLIINRTEILKSCSIINENLNTIQHERINH